MLYLATYDAGINYCFAADTSAAPFGVYFEGLL